MRIRNIKVTIKDRKTVLREFAEAYEKLRQGKDIEPHEEISFENIGTMRKVLTEKRIALLHAIKQHAPESIYALAKIVNRDLKSINTDVHILKNLGLIRLEKIKEERKKVRPYVEFDKLNVEIAI